MLKNKLSYLKSIRNALETYNEENSSIDYSLIQKIYDYTNNLENLDKKELQELDKFITENTISIHHLANIYLDKKGEENLNNMLVKIIPLQVTKPQCNIRIIKGKEETLTDAMTEENKVKVLCKTRKQSKAA